MKTKLILLFTAVVLAGCRQFKRPKACIDGPQKVEFGETATYKWCGDKADEIHWNADYGVSGMGESISITFENPGQHTIWVRGNNKRSKESQASFFVTCTKPSYVWFSVRDYCLSGGQTIVNSPDIVNYKAYLYATQNDWTADMTNGGHNKCLDSVNCSYNTDYNGVGALFKKAFPTGTVLFVSIEHRNPQEPYNFSSNWTDAVFSGSGNSFVNINNKESQDNVGTVYLSAITKKVLAGKWTLTKVITNGTGALPADCNKDDYIRFYPNRTWKYHAGGDNCNGTSVESSGIFGSLGQCMSPSDNSISLTPVSGPFSGFSNGIFKESYSKLSVQVQAGSSNVIFEFSFTN